MATIAVIDDSKVVLEIADAMLSKAGHRTILFNNGRAAIRALGVTPIDLIVTDLYMPEEDGMEVIRAARRICPETPILAMSSASGKYNLLPVARCLGASRTLRKPFSEMELIQEIASLLAEKPAAARKPAKEASSPRQTFLPRPRLSDR